MSNAGLLQLCAKNTSTGQIEVSLSKQYLQDNEWSRAVDWASRAIEKLESHAVCEAYLVLGESYLKLGRRYQAIDALKKAARAFETKDKATRLLGQVAHF